MSPGGGDDVNVISPPPKSGCESVPKDMGGGFAIF